MAEFDGVSLGVPLDVRVEVGELVMLTELEAVPLELRVTVGDPVILTEPVAVILDVLVCTSAEHRAAGER